MDVLRSGDVLLAADLTRLSRSQELAPLLDRLRFRGVRVVGVLDGFDSESPQARMQAGLSGLMSDELRASIRVRTHSALQMRATNGHPTGGKVYGYTAAGEIAEIEAVIVREIFERTAAGESMRGIANDLNARGIPSPGARWNRTERRHDGRWLISALHSMLRNERYIGRLYWNRSTWVKDPDSGNRVRRERPESEWTCTQCPSLVSPEIWAKVQVRMKERATGSRRGAGLRRYLMSGLLVCQRCGGQFVATGKNGSHYTCSTHSQGGESACPVAGCIPRPLAESLVLEPIQRELLSPEAVGRACELIGRWAREESAQISLGAQPAIDSIGAEIADLEELIEAKPARAGTLRPIVEELRVRQSKLQKAAKQEARATLISRIDEEEVRSKMTLSESSPIDTALVETVLSKSIR
jgi:site-specific DNA recombinase